MDCVKGSHSDRLFVESEAARLKLECKTHVAMDLAQRAKERGEGLEAAARAERYGWFEEVVGNRGIVLTGHHADEPTGDPTAALAPGQQS